MNLTAKLKHINYILEGQQKSAPHQCGVTETIFTSYLKQPRKTKEEKEKWTKIYETMVFKRLDV